jgi:hypothetical protein
MHNWLVLDTSSRREACLLRPFVDLKAGGDWECIGFLHPFRYCRHYQLVKVTMAAFPARRLKADRELTTHPVPIPAVDATRIAVKPSFRCRRINLPVGSRQPFGHSSTGMTSSSQSSPPPLSLSLSKAPRNVRVWVRDLSSRVPVAEIA